MLARKEFLFSNLINCTDVTEIQRILSAEASEYWAPHSLPSVRSSRCVKRFGQMILDVLTINLVVPMMFAYGKDHADDAMQERAVEILEQIAPEKNTYTVPWSERGIRPDNAFFSQALIQLSKEYCEKKRCATCNIGKMLLCSQE